jgi:Spy/CpxP family protein refolding chaperone
MSKTAKLPSALAALLVLLAVPALAQRHDRPHRSDRPVRDGARLARFLDLSTEQGAAARQLRTAHRDEVGLLRDELRAGRGRLRALLAAPAPDPSAVGRLVVELHAAGRRLRATRAELDRGFAALLTPEQLLRYDAFKEVVRFHRRAWRAGRGAVAPRRF